MRDWVAQRLFILTRDRWIKLLSFVLAFSTWWLVSTSDPDRTTISLQVDPIAPSGLVALGIPNQVSVSISGPRSQIRSINPSDLQLLVELDKLSTVPGEFALDYSSHEILGLPGSVTVEAFAPATSSIELHREAESEVDVVAVQTGDPEELYMVTQVTLEPTRIRVRGPAPLVEGLREVRTKPVDVTGFRHNRIVDVALDLDERLRPVGTGSIKAQVRVEPKADSKVLEQVPVVVRNYPRWKVEPQFVRVRLEGPAAALREITSSQLIAQVLVDKGTRQAVEVSFTASENPRAEVIVPSSAVTVVQVDPPTLSVVPR